MLDDFIVNLNEVKQKVQEHHSAFVRKNFTNALNDCEEIMEAALSLIGGLFFHDFITLEDYTSMSHTLLAARAKYLEFIEEKIPD